MEQLVVDLMAVSFTVSPSVFAVYVNFIFLLLNLFF